MTKKEFNLIAVAILIISLIYVPTIISDVDTTVSSGWQCIFQLASYEFVDLIRLTLEELAIGVLLFGLWQFVSEE